MGRGLMIETLIVAPPRTLLDRWWTGDACTFTAMHASKTINTLLHGKIWCRAKDQGAWKELLWFWWQQIGSYWIRFHSSKEYLVMEDRFTNGWCWINEGVRNDDSIWDTPDWSGCILFPNWIQPHDSLARVISYGNGFCDWDVMPKSPWTSLLAALLCLK